MPSTVNRLTFSPQEVADQHGVSRGLVYKLLREGVLESIKLGRSRRITAESIERMLAASKAGAA